MASTSSRQSFEAMDASFREEMLCSICGKVFKTKSGMRKHKINKHSDSQPFKCCGRGFVEKNSYDGHRRTEHGKEKLKCGGCNTMFSTKSSLNRHKKIHGNSSSDVNDNICKLCKRSFRRKDELTDHVKGLHGKERRYSCDKCGKNYAWRASLRRHISLKH